MKKNCTFQYYCEKAIAKLNVQDINKFKATTRDKDRIEIIYDIAKDIPIDFCESGKNFAFAEQQKLEGNKLFEMRKYEESLDAYNRGIITCPQNTEEDKQLLTILISNRTAIFYEKGEYRKVFDDIDYITAIGAYPQKLQYKVWLRKAKCYQALGRERNANETYELALSSMKYAQLDEKAMRRKIAEIEQSRNAIYKIESNNEMGTLSNSQVFHGGNKEYVSAHQNIHFDFDPLLGRFARATEKIETGTIVVEEKAHCAVVSHENLLTNCQHCFLSTKQPIPCPNCAHVVFCSSNCEMIANSTYHRIECKIQPILHQSGASINCSMALRMISQKPWKYFQDNQNLLKDYLKDNCKKRSIKKKLYCGDDYMTAFFLCRNDMIRQKNELVHYSVMAIHLLRLLQYGHYFGTNILEDSFHEEELFVASLLLRHLQILQFNSHEISELRNTEASLRDGIGTYYTNENIGAGLYPTLALFNHSCDPSIIRYNVGNKIVARTIKPIKAGEIIYENYGPIYTSMVVEERRAFLKDRYWFDCYCTPCQDEWPLFANMQSDFIKIACQTENCPFEFDLQSDDFCPIIRCDYCNATTKVFPCLKGLSELEVILPEAENCYSSGKRLEATRLFTTALEILYRYSKPPCQDMVKIQQRLKTLFVHFGNKQYGYVEQS